MNATPFPDGFVWGTATSAHQVEGGNSNTDWWEWENDPESGCVEPSGDACDHWNRYPDDIALLADLGFGAYRFSVEWARIEPSPGVFDQAVLDHYADMARACRENGLEAIVTLHHFTTPLWIVENGGWESGETAVRFGEYSRVVANALGGAVDRWCTINEPNIVARMGYSLGVFPPGVNDEERWKTAVDVLVEAHHLSAGEIREADDAPLGLTQAMPEYEALPGGEAALTDFMGIDERPFLEAARDGDFIGVQTYTRERFGPDGPVDSPEGAETNMIGWEYRPQALEAAIRRAHTETGLPVLVTENGLATTDDTRRIDFVTDALEGVLNCIADGIPVEGYCYWSALDNFEWALGYAPTFGLIAVDRETQQRHPKPSAHWLGEVARANALTVR